MNLWKQGKVDIVKYYELKMKRSTNIKSFLFGILLTLLVLLPFLLVLIQVFKVYVYNMTFRFIILGLAWIMLMFANGLSNYFMVKLSKLYYPENPNLMILNTKAILIYESFNIGFGIFTIVAIFIFGVMG